jgi:hypothetical protein|tara:strand:- start:20 stop:241 length:222 start_codon:yes stop_codon:yes gene_type:complete
LGRKQFSQKRGSMRMFQITQLKRKRKLKRRNPSIVDHPDLGLPGEARDHPDRGRKRLTHPNKRRLKTQIVIPQ